jgi:ferric-dicitrate binding protein FerR (iron transport regulator)
MECEHAIQLISADLDGEISADDRPVLDAHLATCESCRASAQAMRLQDGVLRRAFAPDRKAADALADRVISQLRPLNPATPTLRIQWVPVLFAAAAGFLAAVLVFRPWASISTHVADAVSPAVDEGPTTNANEPSANSPNDGGKELPLPPAVTVDHPPINKNMKTQLVFAKGAIEMLPPGETDWRPIATGGTIDPATRVRTDASGRCEFRTPDGSEVRLNGNTELVFHTNRQLELAQGQVWSNVAEDDEPYQIEVPQAQAKVTALGTQFDLACSLLATVLTVVQGTTQVEGKTGRTDLHFGEQAKIVNGAIAERHRVHDLVVATSWVNEILVLKGHDNAELARRMDEMLAQIGNAKMSFMYEKEILQLGDHCVLPLTRFIQSEDSKKDRQKRANAARILAKIARPWSVEDLIGLLADDDREVRFYAAKALERLTDGQTQGLAPDQWRDAAAGKRTAAAERWRVWWQDNKSQFPTSPFPIGPVTKEKLDDSVTKPTKS